MALLRCLLMGSLLLLMLSAALASGQRMLGAPRDVEENDEGVQHALQFAMNEYNKASNDKYARRVVELQRAQIQIVSGLKYILEVKTGRTDCRNPAQNLESCAFHAIPEHKICHFEVHSIPWRSEIVLLKKSCQ